MSRDRQLPGIGYYHPWMPDAITQDMEAFFFFAVWVGSKSDKKFYWTTGILEGDCVSDKFPPW